MNETTCECGQKLTREEDTMCRDCLNVLAEKVCEGMQAECFRGGDVASYLAEQFGLVNSYYFRAGFERAFCSVLEQGAQTMTEPLTSNLEVHCFREIMAIMHRDGEHYRAEHGPQKAAKDAIAAWYERQAEIERQAGALKVYEEALLDISTTFNGHPGKALEAANMAIPIADTALDAVEKLLAAAPAEGAK